MERKGVGSSKLGGKVQKEREERKRGLGVAKGCKGFEEERGDI